MRASDADNPAEVIDLLGVFAAGELSMFGRLAADATTMPTLPLRAELSAFAADEMARHRLLVDRLVELGSSPTQAMGPFMPTFDEFHARLAPATWLEALVKACIADGLAVDLYTAVAGWTDDAVTMEVVRRAGENPRKEVFLVEAAGSAIAQNPIQVGRQSLWARRLFGEVVARGQHLAAEHDGLGALVVGAGGTPGAGLAETLVVFEQVTVRHEERMKALGLNP